MRYMSEDERAAFDAGLPLILEEVDLRNVPVMAEDFTDLQLINCNAEGVDFSLANLERFKARGTNFNGARFEDCTFKEASFEACSLRGTVFIGATGTVDFEDCDTTSWTSPEPPDTLPSEVNGGAQ
jgi:uncharacterized protein YjbI with pentapeptide repeats